MTDTVGNPYRKATHWRMQSIQKHSITYKMNCFIDSQALKVMRHFLVHMTHVGLLSMISTAYHNLVAAIKSQGVKCGLVSNADDRICELNVFKKVYRHSWNTLVSVLESLNLKQFFSSISLSYDVGFEKPDYRIFDHALQQSNLEDIKPKHVLFLGDEYKRFVTLKS